MQIASLYRYPVKGLTPEPLATATLQAGAYFPGDRVYAIENGPAGFDAAAPQHQSKVKFLMLMRNEALARLRTRFEDETGTLEIVAEEGGTPLRATLATEAGRESIAAFFRAYLPGELRGPPKVLEAPDGFRFTDSRSGYVSIINQASVAAIAEMVGQLVDPLRFRGNFMIAGLAAWEEFDLVGRILAAPSGLRLKVTKRIVRCAATNVDPTSGTRDLNIPATLMRELGHADCGVYAEVLSGGPITPGETLSIEPERQGRLAL
jgi:uncharacterized protein YcbX